MPPLTKISDPSTPCAIRRNPESGFVLLTLMFMAGVIAFALVLALPRSGMQSQRVREETLIYRGEQYKRAVQLYFRKYKKYPQKMDDLEESDGIRFLRKRYKDPLTGEDQWRLVHMGADGKFKDSLIYDQQTEEDEDGSGTNANGGRRSGFGGGSGSSGFGSRPSGSRSNSGSGARGARAAASGPSYAPPVNAFQGAELARANRQSFAPALTGQASNAEIMAAGMPGQEGQDGSQPADPNDPNAQPDQAQGQDPDQPGGAVPYPNYSNTLPSQVPSATGAGAPVIPGTVNPTGRQPRQGRVGQGAAARLQQLQQAAGNAGAMAPGSAPAGFGGGGPAGRSAADLIRSLITTPRPGGLAGIRAQQQNAQGNRAAFAEGIAGVASKMEARGVKVYQDHEFYNEWEFVYDYRTDASMSGMAGAGGPAGNINPNQPGLTKGGGLNIDPSQVVPVPGIPGYNGQQPGGPGVTATPGMDANNQPDQQQPSQDPNDPGLPPYGEQPATPAATAPGSNSDTPGSRLRNRRRRATQPLPLPGQSVYPGANPAPPTGAQPAAPAGGETESPQPAVDPNAP